LNSAPLAFGLQGRWSVVTLGVKCVVSRSPQIAPCFTWESLCLGTFRGSKSQSVNRIPPQLRLNNTPQLAADLHCI